MTTPITEDAAARVAAKTFEAARRWAQAREAMGNTQERMTIASEKLETAAREMSTAASAHASSVVDEIDAKRAFEDLIGYVDIPF